MLRGGPAGPWSRSRSNRPPRVEKQTPPAAILGGPVDAPRRPCRPVVSRSRWNRSPRAEQRRWGLRKRFPAIRPGIPRTCGRPGVNSAEDRSRSASPSRVAPRGCARRRKPSRIGRAIIPRSPGPGQGRCRTCPWWDREPHLRQAAPPALALSDAWAAMTSGPPRTAMPLGPRRRLGRRGRFDAPDRDDISPAMMPAPP